MVPGELHLVAARLQLGQVDLGIAADAQHVGGVELHFGAGIRPGRDLIAGEQRSVDHARHPIAGIAAVHRNFAIHQADASHPALEIVRILRPGRRYNPADNSAAPVKAKNRMRFMAEPPNYACHFARLRPNQKPCFFS